jgi:hypothetical protein
MFLPSPRGASVHGGKDSRRLPLLGFGRGGGHGAVGKKRERGRSRTRLMPYPRWMGMELAGFWPETGGCRRRSGLLHGRLLSAREWRQGRAGLVRFGEGKLVAVWIRSSGHRGAGFHGRSWGRSAACLMGRCCDCFSFCPGDWCVWWCRGS